MKAIHANGGRSIFWNSTEHTKLVFYTPPLRSSIIIGKTKTIVDRTAYSFPHQPTIANNNNNNNKEIVNFVTSSDGYLYAWIGSSMYNYNDNGTRILSFRSDQCDTKERIVLPSIEEYSRKMNNYNITIDQFARKCGCPGLSIQVILLLNLILFSQCVLTKMIVFFLFVVSFIFIIFQLVPG